MIEDVSLMNKLEIISGNIPKREWKFFHRHSIKNFILNIEAIKGRSEKAKCIEIIDNCLNEIEANFEPDIDFSIYIYNTYLKYVVPTFQNRLGFWPVPNKNGFIFLIFAVSSIFVFLLKYKILEIIFCTILVIIVIVILDRLKRHKVYGFRY